MKGDYNEVMAHLKALNLTLDINRIELKYDENANGYNVIIYDKKLGEMDDFFIYE